MTQTSATSLRDICKIALWVIGALLGWFFLLDLYKTPLLPNLEQSWIAAITFGAEQKLQFGREIIYTYGPLGHLVFSTYSARLFMPDLVAEICLKGIYVALVCGLGLRLPALARGCFLLAAFCLAVLSYQTMYVFTIASLGWILIQRSRTSDLLLVPVLLFAATAALIKVTFLWFSLLVLACATAGCLLQRRFLRASGALLIFLGAFCTAWFFSGQTFATLPDFLTTAQEVTSGYSNTMSWDCPPLILTLGLAVGLLLLSQLCFLGWRNRRPSIWLVVSVLAAGLFLSWKLGFSRADAHTMEFFYYASLMAFAFPAFFERAHNPLPARIHWTVAWGVLVLSGSAISAQDGHAGSTLISILESRFPARLKTLLHPSAEAAGLRAADLQRAQEFALPRIRGTVGRARIDVFGYEQAIALLNGLNYTPSPSVQTYCDYTPALAQLNAAFYRSDRAPEYVIFKLQRIDNRLAAVDYAEVLVRLAQDYEPLFSEGGYLLLKRQQRAKGPLAAELLPLREGRTRIGENISVPGGVTWCELTMEETLLGKIISFFYHSPEVRMDIATADGATATRRFLPTLGRHGFLLNPLLNSESDFVALAAGQQQGSSTVQAIKIVQNPVVGWSYRRGISYRMSQVSMPSTPKPSAAVLLRYFHGFGDVFSTPASLVKSNFASERFVLENKTFLLVHPIGEVRFDIPAGTITAAGEFAMHPAAYLSGATNGVEFKVECVPSDTSLPVVTLFQQVLRPRTVTADRGIHRFRVELPPGADGQLVLRTLPGPTGAIEWGWAGWSDVQFERTH
jgi:hypothetical protein